MRRNAESFLRAAAVSAAGLVLPLAGCGGSSAPVARGAAQASTSESPAIPLGWLGGSARPLTGRLAIESDGESRTPGGLVLAELSPDAPLALAGARVGDILVRVEDAWVPLEEDPTLDAVELVERQVSAGRAPIRLFVWRGNALVELALAPIGPALEVGLPVEVERFRQAAAKASEHLLSMQREDGGFGGTGTDELASDALAGLALLASGANSEHASEPARAALHALEERIESLLAAPASEPDALALALAVLFEAERCGPLPEEIRRRGTPLQGSSDAKSGADGLPAGLLDLAHLEASSPEDLQALLESMGADVQIMTSDSSEAGEFTLTEGEEDIPEGFQIPEGAQIMISSIEGAVHAEHAGEHAVGLASAPPVDLDALIAELAPERAAALARLAPRVERLLACQGEDGSFGAAELSAEDRLHTSALALLALGCAQGTGLELEQKDAIARSCAWLNAEMHEGKVAAAVARGADRRIIASDSALVAWAFLAAGCSETDPYLHALLDYSDDKGACLLDAPRSIALGSLATAAVRSARDLMRWQRFYDEFRIALVAWQLPDGSFSIPSRSRGEGLESFVSEPPAATAIGLLLLSMQEDRLPVLLGRTPNPFAPRIDGKGEDPNAPKPAATDDAVPADPDAEGEAGLEGEASSPDPAAETDSDG